jgi:hypothetical protein
MLTVIVCTLFIVKQQLTLALFVNIKLLVDLFVITKYINTIVIIITLVVFIKLQPKSVKPIKGRFYLLNLMYKLNLLYLKFAAIFTQESKLLRSKDLHLILN